jgi:hypothetical protein
MIAVLALVGKQAGKVTGEHAQTDQYQVSTVVMSKCSLVWSYEFHIEVYHWQDQPRTFQGFI